VVFRNSNNNSSLGKAQCQYEAIKIFGGILKKKMVGIIPSRSVVTITVSELNYQKKGSLTL